MTYDVGLRLVADATSSTGGSTGGVIGVGTLLLSAGMGAILVALINFFANRHKLGADAAAVLSRAAADLVEPLQRRIHELERDLDRVSAKARRLETDLDNCRAANNRKDQLLITRAHEIARLSKPTTTPT